MSRIDLPVRREITAPTIARMTSIPCPGGIPMPGPPDLGPNTIGQIPYPYQEQGIAWLTGRTSALLADEMGLGKTVQVLRALPRGMPAIVVCPASLRLNWRDECLRWRPDVTPIACAPGEFQVPNRGELAIVSYESLPDPAPRARRWLIPDARASAAVLVVDEAQYTKTPSAQRSVKVRLLATQCARVWFLTGTPMLGTPEDLWGVLSAGGMHRAAFGTHRAFLDLFEEGRLEEVRQRLSRIALRRLRRDVLPELPDKSYQTIPIACSQALVLLLDQLGATWTAEGSELPPFELWSEVRAALAQDRLGAMLETVERFESEGVPLVVWSAHRAPVEAFAGRPGWGVIMGDTKHEDRRTIVDRFQNEALAGVALTIGAGGVGINLSRASTALFVDLDPSPANNSQAEDRLPRPGQKAAGIQILRMVADHPVDRRILEILDRKQSLIDATTGGPL